ncbi:serine hydrolase domain-containing protein [Bailinhaonella thermotolerans]|uniref:serine hydrolase domain-containing protein n=1 Tax=Bailinhaonella thermotolerans TaxID=1070861 RepID=UPI00192A6903|nr:serine hydrolase domain-containing protein [Bailinhaonella thermotolerans]
MAERGGVVALVQRAVSARVVPGAVWGVGDAAEITSAGACGLADPAAGVRMRLDTVFDVASLTKILAPWMVVGELWREQRIDLDAPLGEYWPEVEGRPLGKVTARHLLTHTAGLPPRANLRACYGTDAGQVRRGVLAEDLHRPPGQAVQYTDRAALVLGYLAEHLTGASLDRAAERIWRPLGLHRTRFGPLPPADAVRCAPTELDPETGRHLQGVAHDFSARLLGGVCGIAGVFSVLDDLAAAAQHLLAAAASPGSWAAESLRV